MLAPLAAALAVALVAASPVLAADRKPPRIVGAQMVDADGDGKADRVVLTYSERVRHALDKKAPFSFAVTGYKVTRVGKAKGKKIVVSVAEQTAPDPTVTPSVKYKARKGGSKVTDRTGNPAKKQTIKAKPFGPAPAQQPQPQPPSAPPPQVDGDGDGHIAGDCAPNNPSIHPGAEDFPEPTYTDSNCDGIDGDAASAVFAASSGSDVPGCGELASPCRTLQKGLAEAAAQAKRDVYLRAGTYSGPFLVAQAVNVYGGFDAAWQRGTGGVAVLGGGLDPRIDEYLTLRIEGVGSPMTVADLEIHGPDPDEAGKSSYAVVVRGSAGPIEIERTPIVAGDGAHGADGAPGQHASTGTARRAAMDGIQGGSANEEAFACNITGHGLGGAAGTNPDVVDGLSPTGGGGGNGGEMDTTCGSFGVCDNCNATAGDSGGNAVRFALLSYGYRGNGGAGTILCGEGGPGNDGRIQNGLAGPGGAANGFLVGDFWRGLAGQAGGSGQNGGGGGGGGGSGGCDTGIDSWGAGGGGGGAGGAAARSGGGGGQGGGGSFGVFAVVSTVHVTGSSITQGSGGDGGDGGSGGRGQDGGLGGPGGSASGDSKAGGAGGDGGHGGHGGGGGGGAGGVSYGIYSFASTIVQFGNSFTLGAGGLGGPGGVSAPLAPPAVDDGNDGGTGAAGASAAVGTCASAGAC